MRELRCRRRCCSYDGADAAIAVGSSNAPGSRHENELADCGHVGMDGRGRFKVALGSARAAAFVAGTWRRGQEWLVVVEEETVRLFLFGRFLFLSSDSTRVGDRRFVMAAGGRLTS